MTLPLSETPTVGLGRFIKESRFLVPNHQRDYSWTAVYVRAFLRDIEEALNNKNKIYFCGLMVFTKPEGQVLKVLDGQQRLATTLMIFSAIRNWMRLYKAYDKQAFQIETQLLQTDDIGGSGAEPKLILTPANNTYFQQYVIEAVPTSAIIKCLKDRSVQDRKKILLKSALLINRHIETKASEFPGSDAAKDYFVELIKYLSDTVQVVRLVLSGDDAAYTIFETLNDRGLELAPLDLVKNYLFSRAGRYKPGSLQELEERWAEMMALLGSVRVDSFLRAFWASRHGKMEGSKLYSAFKKTYDTPEKAYQISIDMRAAAERYAALFSSADAVWSDYDDKAQRSVDALEAIGSLQMHPIILAALERFSKQEMTRLLRLLEIIAVRYQLVMRGRAGRIESLGGRAARDIWEKKITKAIEVRTALDELYVPDDQFEQRFRIKTETEGRKARYLLTVLERQSLLRDGNTFADELIPGNVTVEHIFPKSPHGHWEDEMLTDPKLPEMRNRLGNICLLPGVNRALGNKSWDEKLATYAKSRLRTTNTLDREQYPKWGRDAIEKRQGYMAKLAVAAWRFE